MPRSSSHASHQPTEPEEHIQPSEQELKAAFGNSLAVILALNTGTTPLQVVDDDGTPLPECANITKDCPTPRPLQHFGDCTLIRHACNLAYASGFKDVCVVLAQDENTDAGTDEVARAIADEAASFATEHPEWAMQIVECGAAELRTLTKQHANFEILGITWPVLKLAREAAKTLAASDRIMFLRCDQVRLTPWHLLQLAKELDAHPGAHIAASWITWLRRLPLLIDADFLETLDDSPLCAPVSESHPWRPLPHLPLHDVLFGEERLEVNAVIPSGAVQFLAHRTLSALQAVRMARAYEELLSASGATGEDEQPPRVPNVTSASGMGGMISAHNFASCEALQRAIDALGDADKLLFERARRVVEERARMLIDDPALAEHLAAADEFARRERGNFPIFATPRHRESLVYLDSAATAQRLGSALDAAHRFEAYENANIYRGAYELSARATASYNDARASIERFINADRRQTVITANATAALNLVAQAWGERNITRGDTIIVAESEHHSNLLPWMMLANRTGAQLRYVALREDGSLDLDDYACALKDQAARPKLVCMAHMGNVMGMLSPVAHMAARAHEVGARFVLDAAQSVAHFPLDVKRLGADFVAFSGHKIYGPLGIGCLWIAPDAFDEMDPIAAGGGSVSHVSRDSYYLRRGAIQYELGTPPIAQAIGLAAACDHLTALGAQNIRAHDRALTQYLTRALAARDFVTVWGDHTSDEGLYGLVSCSLAGIDSGLVGKMCAEVGVAVRSGGHCALPLSAALGLSGTTRISLGIYNTSEDIDAALVALDMCSDLLL